MMKFRIAFGLALATTVLIMAHGTVKTHAGNPFGIRFRSSTSVEVLAKKIDTLEKHIDEHGSVTAKKPDVWGEARLTRHRREFEEQMAEQLNAFKTTINASLSRSDQAFLANSLALSAAISGPQAIATQPTAPEGTTTTVVQVPQRDDANSNVTAVDTVLKRSNDLRKGLLGFEDTDEKGIALEPTVVLDQMKRYLDHLHEIRRVSEGDDIGDAPGYTINLVRIPVSVLPGKETRQGYGAEITVTATPHLSEKTLPETFRRWVINDLVDELTLPLLKHIDIQSWVTLNERFGKVAQFLDNKGDFPPATRFEYDTLRDELLTQQRGAYMLAKKRAIAEVNANKGHSNANHRQEIDSRVDKYYGELVSTETDELATLLSKPLLDRTTLYQSSSPSRARRSQYSVPTSIRALVYSRTFQHFNYAGGPSPAMIEVDHLSEIAKRMNIILGGKKDVNGRIPNNVARDFLREELKAACDFLSERSHNDTEIWQLVTGLYEAIRDGQDKVLKAKQVRYAELISQEVSRARSTRIQPYDFQLIENLGWCVLVQSALLNQQLIDDMERTAREKNCACIPEASWMQFYLPAEMLPIEATHAFNEYVRCRWPVKAFAVDPVAQEQNVADVFSLRRELQLAASVAFASGNMSAENFQQFARRIELDSETIALNRTVVGFSHGDDTFGWQFRPRFQSPEIKGNLHAYTETLFGGPSRDKLIKDHRLEPGIRECTAILITPSFVPYATFDVRSNWFKLTDPKQREFTLKDTVELSRDVVELRKAKCQCIEDKHLYREGEVYRLMRAVDQLEARLPLQTSYVQMPVEDSKGGFELLSGGMTSLGPELVGFYGEPGYDNGPSNAAGTTVFLIGDNFSIHDTRVIAGGLTLRAADDGTNKKQVRMLSRQILEVTIPRGLATRFRRYDGKTQHEILEVRIATPYGVSGALEVPVVNGEKTDGNTNEAPTLTGFSGAPAYVAATGTRLLLSGANFNREESSVITGGTTIAATRRSSSLLEVNLPKNLATLSRTASNGTVSRVLELRVATNQGVTAAIDIPVTDPTKPVGQTSHAPILNGRHGSAAYHKTNGIRLILTGRHFNAPELRVLAGNTAIGLGPDQVELINGNMIEVTIPGSLATTRRHNAGGVVAEALEVRVATRNGISTSIDLPVADPDQPHGSTSMAPVLNGFFGDAGYDRANGARIILTGRHFNAADLRVLAGGGGLSGDAVTQLSATLVEITLPGKLVTTRQHDSAGQVVDTLEVRIATRNGVSAPVAVPVLDSGRRASTTTHGPVFNEVYGSPAYDRATGNRIVIGGDYFHGENLRVVAGGTTLDVASGQVKVLSRKLLEVSLPKGLALVEESIPQGAKSKSTVLKLWIVTSQGVSGEKGIIASDSEKKKTATAVASVEASLTKKIAEHHPVLYGWEKVPTVAATIVEGESEVERFTITPGTRNGTIAVKATGDVVPDLLAGADKRMATLAFWMTVTSKKKETPAQKIAVGTWSVVVGQPIEVRDLAPAIEKKIKEKIINGFDAKEISLTGYLRFDAHDTEDPPVYRLTDEIKIAVTTVKTNCCPNPDGDSKTGKASIPAETAIRDEDASITIPVKESKPQTFGSRLRQWVTRR